MFDIRQSKTAGQVQNYHLNLINELTIITAASSYDSQQSLCPTLYAQKQAKIYNPKI